MIHCSVLVCSKIEIKLYVQLVGSGHQTHKNKGTLRAQYIPLIKESFNQVFETPSLSVNESMTN